MNYEALAQPDMALAVLQEDGVFESYHYATAFHEDEGYASCMATHETQETPDAPIQANKAACHNLHPHHGTNASSDAAGKVRRYHCSYQNCGKEFSTSGHLARHNRIHTGEKNYVCSECGARFSRQDNCNQHAKGHGKLGRRSSLKKPESVRSETESESRMLPAPTDMALPRSPFVSETSRQSRPMPSHNVSYANSLVTSETGYTSSSNECDLSPVIRQKYEIEPNHFSKLPQSIMDQITDLMPMSAYEKSAPEMDESYQSFNPEFISEEDFYNWSAGVFFTDDIQDDGNQLQVKADI